MDIRETIRIGCALFRGQRMPPWAMRELQDEKLRRLIRHAEEHVPFYRRLLADRGLSHRDIRGAADLPKLPVIAKDELKALPPGELVSSDPRLGPLREELSSGSSGVPFAVRMDRRYMLGRNLRFLRGLTAAGYRWPMKVLLVTADGGLKRPHPALRWRYVSDTAAAPQLHRALAETAPSIFYGCASPLRLLAEHIREKGLPVPALRAVVCTAEFLDGVTRKLLERAFRCPVFDFYGMTEMGLIAWECRERRGYHLAEDAVITELLPIEGVAGRFQLVYTNLDLLAMPLIRYASGDICAGVVEGPCGCGRTLARLNGVEGRCIDALVLRDGRRLSPYQLTDRLDMLPGIFRYKVVQECVDSLTVTVKRDGRPGGGLEQGIKSVIHDVLGSGIRVRVDVVDDIPKGSARKFRLVESRAGSVT